MSTIFGIVGKQGREIDPKWIDIMLQDLLYSKPDRYATWKNRLAALGNLQIYNTPESLREKLPLVHPESGMVVCADARIDNREELAGGLPARELSELTDSDLFLRTYQQTGVACLNRLRGDYSLAVYHKKEHRLFLARDHFGMRPLFYYDHPEYFVFSSEIRAILVLPWVPKKLNTSWLAHFLVNSDEDAFETFYEDIRVVPPGHYLELTGRDPVIHQYWELTIPPLTTKKNDQEYMDEYKRLFDRAVAVRTRSAYPVGSELSGGLDSSSVVSLAQSHRKETGEDLHVFARVLPPGYQMQPGKEDHDEAREIELVCDFCGITNLHRITMAGQRISENIAKITGFLKTPVFSNYPVYNLNLIESAAKASVRTVLSGHGGDQMITNPGYFVYQDYLKARQYITLFRDIRAKGTPNERPVFAALMHLLKLRQRSGNQQEKRIRMKKFHRLGLHPDLISALNLEQIFRNNRDTAIFLPTGLPDLILKITARHMNLRIEATALASIGHHIEFRYPMFDVELVKFYLSLPSDLRYKNQTGRYIHRMAMKDALPPEIQMRKDKGGGINPGLYYLFSNDTALIRKSLTASLALNDVFIRSIFTPDKVQRLIQEEAELIFNHKAIVNKYFLLQPFINYLEEKFA